jgi:hypothetical protein
VGGVNQHPMGGGGASGLRRPGRFRPSRIRGEPPRRLKRGRWGDVSSRRRAPRVTPWFSRGGLRGSRRGLGFGEGDATVRTVAPSGFACCYITRGYIIGENSGQPASSLHARFAWCGGDTTGPARSPDASGNGSFPPLRGFRRGSHKTPSIEKGRLAQHADSSIHNLTVPVRTFRPRRWARRAVESGPLPRGHRAVPVRSPQDS